MLAIKRVYEKAEPSDGYRVLVDRLWPRGVSKQRAGLDLWMKEIAPSDKLRKWFHHDERRWSDFASKYRKELAGKKDLLRQIKKLAAEHDRVTLLYSAHDAEHNQAVVLRNLLKGSRAR